MYKVISLILCFFFGSYSLIPVNGSSIPYLNKSNGVFQLMVDDKPFLILGGELMNTSGFDLAYMEEAWKRVAKLNVNTVFVPVSWQQFEPEEGMFDPSYLESHIRNARVNKMKLVILWFGSWKNGVSSYAPQWVLSDTNRFPRVEDQDGKLRNVLSSFGEATMRADARAFERLMEEIKRIDQSDHTVIMVQVENEVGLYGMTRDVSSAALTAFNREVPEIFKDYIQQNIRELTPHLSGMTRQIQKMKGSWEQLFGEGPFTDELFMAWHYAAYMNTVAQRGKAVYPLPIMVNAWLDDPQTPEPGKHLSGGPVARVLDAWMAAAPAIDIYSPDIYHLKVEDFKEVCARYRHRGNPLLIPECCAIWLNDTLSAPAKAFYSIAQEHALGFSPFGIDHEAYYPGHPLKAAYKVLSELKDLILAKQGTSDLRGFMEGASGTDTLRMKDYVFAIDYRVVKEAGQPGYGMVIQLDDHTFIFAGVGFNVEFLPADPGNSGVSILQTASVKKSMNGEWLPYRFNGGDETLWMGKTGLKFPPNPYDIGLDYNEISIQKAKMYIY